MAVGAAPLPPAPLSRKPLELNAKAPRGSKAHKISGPNEMQPLCKEDIGREVERYRQNTPASYRHQRAPSGVG